MNAVVWTPDLKRAVADYTDQLGFACLQHIPGVLALVSYGSLHLQLWACGAKPGRWEKQRPGEGVFAPGHVSAVVSGIHRLHAGLRRAWLQGQAQSPVPLRSRVCACGPQAQAWGAWEFAFADGDGNVIHCVDWMLPAGAASSEPTPGVRPFEEGGAP